MQPNEEKPVDNIERRDWEFAEDDGLVVETRADGRPVLTGYAVRYNTLSVDLGGFREQILPGAFDKVLNRQRGKGDVVALFNHDPNQLLGRTSSGTLELASDDKGLRYTVSLPNTELGRMIAEMTARKDLRGSSFAFTVDQKGESWAPGEDGKPRRSIREVTGLFDVSVVTHPAYASSTVAVARRSMEAWMQEERCRCSEMAAAEEPPAAGSSSADLQSVAMRLVAARLRSMLRCEPRGFCATGSGGGIDNSCGKEGGGGGGGGQDSGGSGGGDGGKSGKVAAAGASGDGSTKDTSAGKQRKERLRDRIEGTQKEADREVQKAKAKEDKIRTKLDETKKQLSDLKSGKTLSDAQAKVKAAESKLASSQQKVADLKKAGEASKARMAELKAKLDAMKKRSAVDDIEAAMEAEDKESARILESLKQASADLDDVLSMIESLV